MGSAISKQHIELASLLIDLEAAMRNGGLWSERAPPADAFGSTEPFSVDTMSFQQWLQFVFLPTLRELCQLQAPLPERCGVRPMAEEVFAQRLLNVAPTLAVLAQIDDFIEAR